MMVRKRLWLQVIWGTIATIALSSCAKTLEASKIEEIIKADLNKQSGLSVKSITCPMGIKSEPGKTFECIGELDPDGGFFITVKQEDEQGRVSWEVPNSWRLLNLTQLEAEFKQKLMAKSQLEPKVDCGSGYRATKPGDSFECKLVQQLQQRKQLQEPKSEQTKLQTKLQQKSSLQSDTIVVRVEPEGNVTWQEVRILAAQPPTSASVNKASNPSAKTQTSPSTDLPPEVGIKDNTGWTQLSD
jgi:hypothetical protein